MKKIISLMLALIICLCSITAYALQGSITPYYIHIKSMSHQFDINTYNGAAIVDADMETKSGDYCTITAQVKRETVSGWQTVVTYRTLGTTEATIEEDTNLTRGYNYKCTFTFTVYDENDFIIEQKSYSEEANYT